MTARNDPEPLRLEMACPTEIGAPEEKTELSTPRPRSRIVCTFCGRPVAEVAFMFAANPRLGSGGAICDGCVDRFSEALKVPVIPVEVST